MYIGLSVEISFAMEWVLENKNEYPHRETLTCFHFLSARNDIGCSPPRPHVNLFSRIALSYIHHADFTSRSQKPVGVQFRSGLVISI